MGSGRAAYCCFLCSAQIVPNFRVRMIPVLGTLPAMFGLAAASHVLCELAAAPFAPEPVRPSVTAYAVPPLALPVCMLGLLRGSQAVRCVFLSIHHFHDDLFCHLFVYKWSDLNCVFMTGLYVPLPASQSVSQSVTSFPATSG